MITPFMDRVVKVRKVVRGTGEIRVTTEFMGAGESPIEFEFAVPFFGKRAGDIGYNDLCILSDALNNGKGIIRVKLFLDRLEILTEDTAPMVMRAVPVKGRPDWMKNVDQPTILGKPGDSDGK